MARSSFRIPRQTRSGDGSAAISARRSIERRSEPGCSIKRRTVDRTRPPGGDVELRLRFLHLHLTSAHFTPVTLRTTCLSRYLSKLSIKVFHEFTLCESLCLSWTWNHWTLIFELSICEKVSVGRPSSWTTRVLFGCYLLYGQPRSSSIRYCE